MFGTRTSGYLAVLIVLSVGQLALGQGLLLMDGSGSIAGFANADPERLRGVIQRLHANLSVAGPSSTQTAFLRDTPEGNRLDQRTPREFAAMASLAGNYKRDTPLQWGIEQA